MKLYLLSAYNFLSDVLKTAYTGAEALTNAVCNYLNGTSNEWYFVHGTGVIPAVAYSSPSASYGDRILWIYNSFRNTLVQKYHGVQPPSVKCNWLSTQLIVDGTTYTLDDWLREFYIVIDNYDEFTVSVLIDAWSVRHRIWPTDDAELHIIDSEGASHVFSVSDPINEEWSALVPKPRVEEEPYIEDEDSDVEEDLIEETEEETEEETSLLDTYAPIAAFIEAPTPSVEPPIETSIEPPAPEVTPLPQSPAPEQEDAVSNE